MYLCHNSPQYPYIPETVFSHKNIMYVHKLFRVLISITKVTKYLNWFLQWVCLLIISPLRKNYNSISMTSIWQMGKHKACFLHCCLALLSVSAGCDPSRGFIWCKRQELLTSLEKVEGVTRRVEAGGSGALVAPWRKVAMDCVCPQDPGQHTEFVLAAIWNVGRMLTEWNLLKGLVPLICFPHMFLHPQTWYLGIQSISRKSLHKLCNALKQKGIFWLFMGISNFVVQTWN